MDETVLFPSPNWFQPSGLAVSCDEWLVYGGPSKSLCVLEPLPADHDCLIKDRQGYTAHVVNRAHPEKITTVDICPEWPEKRCVLSGSADGMVKQWSLEKVDQNILKIKPTHSHEIHHHQKEEVVGVGYCKDGYAVSVGCFGHIVKWDMNSNVTKSFDHVMKNFRPVTMACSPHVHMQVAIGTKQGVLFVFDLNGTPRPIYKVRVHDDEIIKVSWCPQYEVAIRKALKEHPISSNQRSAVTERLEAIRNEVDPPEVLEELDKRVWNSQTSDQPVLINTKLQPIINNLMITAELEKSAVGKTLPDDSFDNSVVQEDDMFDIYKDHEADEFGHKKYQPIDILVKIPKETEKVDYLVECQKLKDEILQRKAHSEASIEELVEAIDKTQLEAGSSEAGPSETGPSETVSFEAGPSEKYTIEASPTGPPTAPKPNPFEGKITKGEVESSVHIQKHLLATIGKHGSIRIWSKTGKLVGSCAVTGGGGGGRGRGARRAGCTTLVWARPDSLLVADGASQLLDCNPLKLDCKNKLEWTVLHTAHMRGLYALASSAPRTVRVGERSSATVWSAAQDRVLARCCLDTRRLDTYLTCGGFLYTVMPCPYDARRVSISVGDGNVRVWEADTLTGDDSRLRSTRTLSYWQNIGGKILVTAWHPVKENQLAFATAESRVGLIDVSRPEKPATLLQPAFSGGVYALSWAGGDALYACGSGKLAVYHTARPDQEPTTISVELEGVKWEVSTVAWYERGTVVGSNAGAVALLSPNHDVVAAAFIFNKMIHTLEWHPQSTDSEGEPGPYNDLIAVCSLSKANTVVILQYQEEQEGKKLSVWKTLTGHTDTVLQVVWSPHDDNLLLSTSQDGTVRVWDVEAGTCTHVFGGHVWSALGAAWLAWPCAPRSILSGGADCCLRLWRLDQHPQDQYQATKYEVSVEKSKKKEKKQKAAKERARSEDVEGEGEGEREGGAGESEREGGGGEQALPAKDLRRRNHKKFLLPMTEKQMSSCTAHAARVALQRKMAAAVTSEVATAPYGEDFLDVFGNINQLNRLLDNEMECHIDTGAWESWVILGAVRGSIDEVVQKAARTHALDPFLLSLAPQVSYKYWRDVTLLYLQQIDWLTAKGDETKLSESKQYGGALYRKVAVLLSLHDVKAAVGALIDARLYKEAYVLSRTRYMDSLAEQTLQAWAHFCLISCQYIMSAICYITLGDLSQAVSALSKTSDEETLSLAADIAKTLGQNTFAGHIEEKRQLIQTQKELDKETLEKLPTRAEIIEKQNDKQPQGVENKVQIVNEDITEHEALNKVDEVGVVANERTEIQSGVEETVENQEKKMIEELEDNENTGTVEELLEYLKEASQCLQDIKKVIVTESDLRLEDQSGIKDTLVGTESETRVENPEDQKNKKVVTTEDLLDKLPEAMQNLLKESVLKVVVSNGQHNGDGDVIKNCDNNTPIDTDISEKGDQMSQTTSD